MGERKPSIRKKWRVATSLLLALLLVLPVGVVKGETLNEDERLAVCFDFENETGGFVKSSTSDDQPVCWPFMRGEDLEVKGLTPAPNAKQYTAFNNVLSQVMYFDKHDCNAGSNHIPTVYKLSINGQDEGHLPPEGVSFYGKPYTVVIYFVDQPKAYSHGQYGLRNYLAKKDIKLTFHQQIQPKLNGVTLETGDTIDDPGMFVKNIQDYWRDKEFFQKFILDPEVDTHTAGTTATWIYPEGGQRRHGVGIDVTVVPKYEFEHVTITRVQNPGVSVSEGDFVKVKGGRTLPRWTQVKGHTGDLTLDKLGKREITVDITIPNLVHPKKTIKGTLNVVGRMEDAYEPIGKNLSIKRGSFVSQTPEDYIANLNEMPEGTNYYWAGDFPNSYDLKKIGLYYFSINARYPDGTEDQAVTTIKVVDEFLNAQNEPIGQDIYVRKGEEAKASDGIANRKELKEINSGGIRFTAPVDTSTTGTKPAEIEVEYRDWTTDKVKVNVIVVDKLECDKYNPQPKDIRVKQHATVDPKWGIANLEELPEDAKIYFVYAVSTEKVGTFNTLLKVMYKDRSVDELRPKLYVEGPDNELYTPQGQNLTVKQNAVVEAKSGIANTAELPDDATYTFKNGAVDTSKPGEQKATVVVTYADKTTDEVEITITVEKLADNEKYEPQGKNLTVKQNAVVDAKSGIANTADLPNDATYAFKNGAVDTSQPGEQKATVVVTYADKTTDEIEITITVEKLADNEKYEPQGKNLTVKQNAVVDAKSGIANTADLPNDATYTFKNGAVDTSKPGEQKATVVVTYADKTTDEVEITVTVEKLADNEKYEPETKDIEVEKNGKVDPKDTITNKDKLPEDTTYTFKDGDVDTSKPGEQDVTVVVTYPDKTTDEVTVKVTVKDTTPGGGTTPGGTTPGGTTPGTDIPKDVDTDGDGLTDKKEKEMGTDPSKKDTDGDGLTDKEEADLGTDPLKKDTDGDGYTDGQEVKAGSNPKDKNLVPKKPGNVAAPKTGDPMALSTLALLLTSAAGAVAYGKKNRRK